MCSLNHLNTFLKKLGETYGLQDELSKQKLNHSEIYGDTWMVKRNEWLPYLKRIFSNLTLICARYSMNMESITSF